MQSLLRGRRVILLIAVAICLAFIFSCPVAHAGEVSSDYLWLSTELNRMPADGGRNNLRFICYYPAQVTFYLGSSTLPNDKLGNIIIDSPVFEEDTVLYAHYVAPDIEASETLYGDHTVLIQLEAVGYETHSVGLYVTLELGDKPAPQYSISGITARPSAQSGNDAHAIIPADSDCYAIIDATVANIPDGQTATVRFEHKHRYGGFVSRDQSQVDVDNLEVEVSSDHPVARVFYHNTQEPPASTKPNYSDTITASIGSSEAQAKVDVGMHLYINNVKTYLKDEENAQFGIQTYVDLNGRPDFNLEQYSSDYSEIWSRTPDHSLESFMRIGASLEFDHVNTEKYDYLMALTPWGGASTFDGFAKFVNIGGSNILENAGVDYTGPTHGPAGHLMPGINLNQNGMYTFVADAKLAVYSVLQGTQMTEELYRNWFWPESARFCLVRADAGGLFQNVVCSLAPTSKEQYIMLELLKLASKPTDAVLFFTDIVCKLASGDLTGATLAVIKQKVGDRKDDLTALRDQGKITDDQLKDLIATTVTKYIWDAYEHGKNLYTQPSTTYELLTNHDKSKWGSNGTIKVQPGAGYFRGSSPPIPQSLNQLSVDEYSDDYDEIPMLQLMPADPEYQHFCTCSLAGWTGPDGYDLDDYIIISAVGVTDAELLLNGTTPVAQYDPENFDYDDVEPAMEFSSDEIALFYMPADQSASLSVTFTNPAAVTVIDPASGEYSVYSLPVDESASATLDLAPGDYDGPLSMTIGWEDVDVEAKTYSLTGSAWVTSTIEPGAAAGGDVAWRLGDGNGRLNGRTMQVSPGTYTVQYGLSDDWQAPYSYEIRAIDGKTNSLYGIYGEPGKSQYYDFGESTDLSDWRALSGPWSVGGGTYRMAGTGANIFALSQLQTSASNYTFSADVKKEQGDSDDTVYSYGILARGNRSFDNYYEFLITTDGRYMLARREGSGMATLIDYTLSDKILTGYGVWNNLRCTADGDALKFYINGQMECVADTAYYDSGYPGLLAIDAAASDPNDLVAFNNIQYIPLADDGWESGFSDLGGGWRYLGWLGYYAMLNGGWYNHLQHSYLYVSPQSLTTSIYFYTMDMGWIWTNSTMYPYLLRFSDGAWLWYQMGSKNPRWFNNLSTGSWEQH